MAKIKDLGERLLTGIILEGSCWIWQRGKNKGGYGQIKVDGQQVGAHVVSYEYFVGPVPLRTELHHTCENHACINPEHLVPITRLEHLYISPRAPACVNAAKTHCLNGHLFDPENTYWTKLGQRCCRKCRAMRLRRWRAKQLAA